MMVHDGMVETYKYVSTLLLRCARLNFFIVMHNSCSEAVTGNETHAMKHMHTSINVKANTYQSEKNVKGKSVE